jgi:predicted transcriptional regulator
MAMTTIKVSVELRDRLALIARREHTSIAGAIEKSVDRADTATFWEEMRAALGAERDAFGPEAGRLSGTLTDGLDPDEDWSDLL